MVSIKAEYPPNIAEIRAQLPLEGNEIFAYDGVIYNPQDVPLPRYLIEHEKVHFKQQGVDPAGWWQRYLEDPEFRLHQEAVAHRVEYRVFCQQVKDRNARARALELMAVRLASPRYGSLMSIREARQYIRG